MDEQKLKNKITLLNEEIEKIDFYLSNYTDRTSSLFTIAGLLSFLPPIVINNNIYIFYFLEYTLPFLLVALISYIPASFRIQSIIKLAEISSKPDELIDSTVNVIRLECVWKKSVENYDRVLKWSRFVHGLIYAYVISLVLNFYTFVFFGKPGLCMSLAFLIISCILPTIFFGLTIFMSEKGKVINSET